MGQFHCYMGQISIIKYIRFDIDDAKVYINDSTTAISATIYSLADVEKMFPPDMPFPEEWIPYKFYVPVRLVAESFGFIVEWDGENGQVVITEDVSK